MLPVIRISSHGIFEFVVFRFLISADSSTLWFSAHFVPSFPLVRGTYGIFFHGVLGTPPNHPVQRYFLLRFVLFLVLRKVLPSSIYRVNPGGSGVEEALLRPKGIAYLFRGGGHSNRGTASMEQWAGKREESVQKR